MKELTLISEIQQTLISGMTKSQKRALLKTRQGKNIFLSGIAGAGKTWFLKHLEELFPDRPIQLWATTGMTAINLGGSTISSRNGLRLGLYDQSDEEIIENSKDIYIPENSLIVIDEVGFLSEGQFRQVDLSLRTIRNSKEFLGGFQVIVGGDFGQLPSIHWGESLEGSDYLKKFEVVELVENVRQKDDPEFFENLMEVRNEGVTTNVLNFLEKNSSYEKQSGPTLVATRELMDRFNNRVKRPTDFLTFDCPEADADRPYEEISVWEGMPVIITRNNNRDGYCNGDLGVVVEIYENRVVNDEDEFDDDDDDDDFQNDYSRLSKEKPIVVQLLRTGEEVLVRMSDKTYEKTKLSFSFSIEDGKTIFPENVFEEGVEYFLNAGKIMISYQGIMKEFEWEEGKIYNVKFNTTEYYEYLPVLPAYYLSPRRVQGLTLPSGNIHKSVLNAQMYTPDWISVQYVALSRFEKIHKVTITGLHQKLPLLDEEHLTVNYY